MPKKSTSYIATNERGYRVGQDHHNAKLTDIEVDALIRDRGPEDAPTMSLSQLAKRYGLSKSGVKGILDGNRRGQAQRLVKKSVSEREHTGRSPKVRAEFAISLRSRTILQRAGGAKMLERIACTIETAMARARSDDPDQAMKRILGKLSGL